MNLWLNPHVDAATEVSDFDLRALRTRRISLYLAVSPDNLQRVAPLYNLLFQQLIDLNTRCLPEAGSGTQVLVLLDEFARLGVASVLAQSFAYVAGYGLRLLPVIQSPAQLRALYGADITEEIISNCGAEVVFAPKELKVAQALSERLGAYTYAGRALSRPSGWSSGRRSLTDSDQRRPLMLPQELLQLPRDALIVLRTGVAPIRGRKITYFRERAFTARLRSPPVVKPRACADRATAAAPGLINKGSSVAAPISGPAAAALNVDPLPSNADDAAVDAWVDRYLDRTLGHRHGELDHA